MKRAQDKKEEILLPRLSLSDLSRLSRDVPRSERRTEMEKNKEARAKKTRSVLGERTKRETDVPLEQDKCNCYVTLPFPVYAREKKKKDKCPCTRFLFKEKNFVGKCT